MLAHQSVLLLWRWLRFKRRVICNDQRWTFKAPADGKLAGANLLKVDGGFSFVGFVTEGMPEFMGYGEAKKLLQRNRKPFYQVGPAVGWPRKERLGDHVVLASSEGGRRGRFTVASRSSTEAKTTDHGPRPSGGERRKVCGKREIVLAGDAAVFFRAEELHRRGKGLVPWNLHCKHPKSLTVHVPASEEQDCEQPCGLHNSASQSKKLRAL